MQAEFGYRGRARTCNIALQRRASYRLNDPATKTGRDVWLRTRNLRVQSPPLCQLSYIPKMVGPEGVEPTNLPVKSRLLCQLSYGPKWSASRDSNPHPSG